MDHNTVILIELWALSGALIGSVVTPIVTEKKTRIGDWGGMVVGLVVGAVGSLVLLVPLWLALSRLADHGDSRLAWQRDAMSAADAEQDLEGNISPLTVFQDNLWPASRPHSHRMSYVGVFVALAIITALEVTLTYLDLSFSIVGPLVALSTTKVLLVAMYFMHLRFDSRWYSAIFVITVPFAALVLIVLALA